jgi:hypothetical protein
VPAFFVFAAIVFLLLMSVSPRFLRRQMVRTLCTLRLL